MSKVTTPTANSRPAPLWYGPFLPTSDPGYEGEPQVVTGLDKIDMKILAVLQDDAALSAAEVADVVGLSQSPCWRRIQRLKDEGYISKVVAILNRQKLNLRTQLFVHVKVVRNDKDNLLEFSQAIRAFPEVMECHVILGVYDFMLRVVAADMDAYQKFFFDKLSLLPNIREVNSFVAVTEIKATTALPLRR